MGLILDTSILIAAERTGLTAEDMLLPMQQRPSDEIAISVVSTMEFAVGIARADSEYRRKVRQTFLEEVQAAIPVIPIDRTIAFRAGEIDGAMQATGMRIGSLDLLIGVTALEAQHAVVTKNVRHFRMIPGLKVIAV